MLAREKGDRALDPVQRDPVAPNRVSKCTRDDHELYTAGRTISITHLVCAQAIILNLITFLLRLCPISLEMRDQKYIYTQKKKFWVFLTSDHASVVFFFLWIFFEVCWFKFIWNQSGARGGSRSAAGRRKHHAARRPSQFLYRHYWSNTHEQIKSSQGTKQWRNNLHFRFLKLITSFPPFKLFIFFHTNDNFLSIARSSKSGNHHALSPFIFLKPFLFLKWL